MAIIYRYPNLNLANPGFVYTDNEKEAAMAAIKGFPVSMISGDWFPMKATWNLSVDHQGVK